MFDLTIRSLNLYDSWIEQIRADSGVAIEYRRCGTLECMDQITAGKVLHLGTYNGNPLCMAAAKAVLAEVCTPEATEAAIARNRLLLDACDRVIRVRDGTIRAIERVGNAVVIREEQPLANRPELQPVG